MNLKKSKNPNIYYCFGSSDDSLAQLKNGQRSIFISDKVISKSQLVMADQTHSTETKLIDDSDLGSGFCEDRPEIPIVDGFITDISNVFIVIKGADCTPVLIYSKSKNAVGGCHSGREGTKSGIVKELIKKFLTEFAVPVADLIVMIGPAISGSNYQVSEEIFNEFVDVTKVAQEYRKIDMQKVIIRDILEMGLRDEQIVMNSICTYSNPNYFSYRRDKTKERQLSIIGITDGKIFK